MKFFILLLILNVVYAVYIPDRTHDRGCLYDPFGDCYEDCPVGTHSYDPSCSTLAFSERTCKEPEKKKMGYYCDLSRCECDEPTVKDKTTGKCVKLEDCPK